jgi:RNA polymerase sigma-70 factor (ECF subfamily)
MKLIFTQPGVAFIRLALWSTGDAPEVGKLEYEDNKLVERARRGDMNAFEELFKRHQKRIYNIAMHLLANETEAADATQEAFVRAYRSLGKLKSNAAFVTWLKTTAINICRDMLRRRGVLKIDSLDAPTDMADGSSRVSEIADWTDNPERSMERKDLRESVRRAIGSLSPVYRETVTLFYVDGADVAEIAKVLGCPTGTIKARLSRARAELKRKLEHHVR